MSVIASNTTDAASSLSLIFVVVTPLFAAGGRSGGYGIILTGSDRCVDGRVVGGRGL